MGGAWLNTNILIECLLDPIFLIGVSSCRYNIFFPSGDIGFDVLTLTVFIGDVVPFLSLFFLGLHHDSHHVVALLIASSSSNAGFREVHDIEGVLFAFNSTFGLEIEPLLMASGVCINLHEQVVTILLRRRFLSLQQVAALKHRVK